jgi:hypothetical protein
MPDAPWWRSPLRGDCLDEADRDAIWTLMTRHAVKDRARFEATLATCDQVWLIRRADRVAGLVCYATYDEVLEGREFSVLYGHWFVLDADVRGSNLSTLATLRTVLELKRRRPFRPVFGLTKCSTVASYLTIIRSAPWAYPSRTNPLTTPLAALRDRVMARAAGEAWDGERGVYRGSGVFEYREGRATAASSDPDAAFYAARNPCQDQGDGLVVIVPCDLKNVVGLLANMARRAVRRLLAGRPTTVWTGSSHE